MVVMDDALRVEVGTVVQGMGVGDHDDIVMIRNGRSNGGINAEESVAHPVMKTRSGAISFRRAARLGAGKGIVEGLVNDNIGSVANKLGKKRLGRDLWFEVVALAASMLQEDEREGTFANTCGEPD